MKKENSKCIPTSVFFIIFLREIIGRGKKTEGLYYMDDFSTDIHFSTRVEVLLFSGNRVLVFLGLPCLLGASYLSGELFQLFQQVLVGDSERLHLVRVGLYCL